MRRMRILFGPLLAATLISGTALAAPADPYVVYTANSYTRGAVILRTDPVSGSLVEVSRNGPQGTLFRRPYDLAVEPDGNLVVADLGEPNQKDGAVIRVDPLTGVQSVVSSGGEFFDPAGIAVAPDGRLYVADNRAPDADGAVIEVDPRTGSQRLVTQRGYLDLPFGIALDHGGKLVVTNRMQPGLLDALCGVVGNVVRIDPVTGLQERVTEAGRLAWPLGVEVASDGRIVVANECPGGAGLVGVNPFGGQADITGNGGQDVLVTPERVAFDPDGAMLVSDFNVGPDGDGGIVRVDPGGGQALVHAGELFNRPLGIAAVANRPPSAVLDVDRPAVAAGRPVRLDASRSGDPEGLPLVYEWDLDSDGVFEVGSGGTATASRTFSSHGPATVRVRVNDRHGARAVAEAGVFVDGAVPVMTRVRADSRVLGVGPPPKRRGARGAALQRRPPPRATAVRFDLSEAATVRVAVQRARHGRRAARGRPCRVHARRGRRCIRWVRQRVVRRAGAAGSNAIRLRSRGLRPGRYLLVLRSVDRVGNASTPRTLPLRVVRLRG